MKIIFMGTPDFSVPVLDALVQAGHDIVCVYCQPPRPAGRGKQHRPTPVHARADELGLMVRHPETLNSDAEQTEFAALNADIAVVVAYGLILPQSILDAPKLGCLNIHASLLPRWRGAAPIHRAIMAGDTETGVCIMQMEAGLDTGPVLTQSKLPIDPNDTTQSLHDKLASLGANLIIKTLDALPTLDPTPQSQSGIVYAQKIDKSESRIDWTKPATEIDRQIRGLSPFPGAWFEHNGTRVKVLGSHPTDPSGTPGQILDAASEIIIACGSGSVSLTRLQRAGKSPQSAKEFLHGFNLSVGSQIP